MNIELCFVLYVVVQDICQHFLDYKIFSTFLVRDFKFNGRKVFGHAPEDFYIKMMMKVITPSDEGPHLQVLKVLTSCDEVPHIK